MYSCKAYKAAFSLEEKTNCPAHTLISLRGDRISFCHACQESNYLRSQWMSNLRLHKNGLHS